MRKIVLGFLLFAFCVKSYGQNDDGFVYMHARDLQLVGKAMQEGGLFHRVDTAKFRDMPIAVKRLFTNSSGLAISFVTNSTEIKAKWTVPSKKQYPNMTPIMQKGLDLYIRKEGTWQHAGVGIPKGVNSACVLVESMNREEKECLLYLPLYDEITNLQIGVRRDAYLKKQANPFKGKIVVYGSSITQGASASRPGLAYPSILSRSSGWQFINFGLSGRGKMELSVANMLAQIEDVDAFVLDCIPNPSPKEIEERTVDFVQTIRARHKDVPIIIIQSLIREKGNFNQKVRTKGIQQKEAIDKQVKLLYKMGVKNLYYIREDDFLGTDHEGTIDGVHPTDQGFGILLKKIKPVLAEILDMDFH